MTSRSQSPQLHQTNRLIRGGSHQYDKCARPGKYILGRVSAVDLDTGGLAECAEEKLSGQRIPVEQYHAYGPAIRVVAVSHLPDDHVDPPPLRS